TTWPRIFTRVLMCTASPSRQAKSLSLQPIAEFKFKRKLSGGMFLKKSRCIVRPRSLVLVLLLAWFAGSIFVFAQTPPKKPEPQQGGGVSTGTPVNYSSRRTAGITDPKAPVVFEDVTDKTALAAFKHR